MLVFAVIWSIWEVIETSPFAIRRTKCGFGEIYFFLFVFPALNIDCLNMLRMNGEVQLRTGTFMNISWLRPWIVQTSCDKIYFPQIFREERSGSEWFGSNEPRLPVQFGNRWNQEWRATILWRWFSGLTVNLIFIVVYLGQCCRWAVRLAGRPAGQL